MALYADGTAIIALIENSVVAFDMLQFQVNKIGNWLKWRARVNADKSVHVTFTLRRRDCHQILGPKSKLTLREKVIRLLR